MHCKHCHETSGVLKKGSFRRKTGFRARIRRYFCRLCSRHFSEQTDALCRGHRRPELNGVVAALLASGVSQRRTAALLGTTQVTVARKLVRIGIFAARHEATRWQNQSGTVKVINFDEMETFEHSKCKPVAIAVAVEQGTERIIDAKVSRMPAKGRLAAIARRRYGYRKDCRSIGLRKVLRTVAMAGTHDVMLKSDSCPRYPKLVAACVPNATLETSLSRKACVVGQGELKAGGFDPLFYINHACAMYRDNVKRLSRRTWCTTKRPDRLQALVDLYRFIHNAMIDHKLAKKSPGLRGGLLSLIAGAGI